MHRKQTRRLILFVIILLLANLTLAQDEDLFPGGRYDSRIPTPLQILEHRFGERHTFHWEMEKYIHILDEASPRIQVKSCRYLTCCRYKLEAIISHSINCKCHLAPVLHVLDCTPELMSGIGSSDFRDAEAYRGWITGSFYDDGFGFTVAAAFIPSNDHNIV